MANPSWKNPRHLNNKTSERRGCTGCFGSFIAFWGMVGLMLYGEARFLQWGLETGMLTDLLALLGGNTHLLLPVSLVALGLGVLLTCFAILPEMRMLDEIDKTLAASQSQYDQENYARRMAAKKKAGPLFKVGLVLFFVPLAVVPFWGLVARNAEKWATTSESVTPGEVAGIFTTLPLGFCMVAIVLLLIAYFMRASSGLRIKGGAGLDKETVVYQELAKLFGDVLFLPKGAINQQLVAHTQLVAPGNRFASNDYIRGIYKTTKFEQADVTVKTVTTSTYTDKDGHRQTRTTSTEHFSGRWLVMELPKVIQGEWCVYSKKFPKPSLKRIANTHQRVKLEDSAFNAHFEIYATNPHDVFYVLTPALIERLKALAGVHGAPIKEGLALYCSGGLLHFAVNGAEDAFEFLFLGAFTEEEVRNRVRRDISLITDLIDAAIS